MREAGRIAVRAPFRGGLPGPNRIAQRILRQRARQRQNCSRAPITSDGYTLAARQPNLKPRRRCRYNSATPCTFPELSFDANDVGMLGESGCFRGRQRNAGELRNRIEHNGNRRFVCHAPVMRDKHFGLVCRFVVVRSLHQRRVIPQLCRPLRAFNRLRR